MSKSTKLTYQETRDLTQKFADQAFAKYQSNSYAAGYFQVLAAQMLAELPKARQAEIAQQLRTQFN